MKKLSVLVSLLTLIAFCPSCKKDHHGCYPQETPCPPTPYAVGMMVVDQGFQVDGYVMDVTMYFVNSNDPNTDTTGLNFTIGGALYLGQTGLPLADSQHLGTMIGTIGGLPADAFSAVTKGFHLHQRCDCDSSYFASSYNTALTMPSAEDVNNKEFPVSQELNGITYYSKNNDLLKKIIETKISAMRFNYQKYVKK